MQTRTWGRTGIQTGEIGIGCEGFLGKSPEQVMEMVDIMEAAGVNCIDLYTPNPEFRDSLGLALRGRREKFILATKSMARTQEDMARDIETSLRNLRTDHIDLYQIHNPNLQQLEQVCAPGGAVEALQAAKAAGKIAHLGLTAHSLEVFQRGLELDWVETIMFPYNIVENQGTELMEQAAAKGVGFIDMKPLAGGAIEDAALALRFVLSNPHVSIVIPGMYEPQEVSQNAAAAGDSSPLSDVFREFAINYMANDIRRR